MTEEGTEIAKNQLICANCGLTIDTNYNHLRSNEIHFCDSNCYFAFESKKGPVERERIQKLWKRY